MSEPTCTGDWMTCPTGATHAPTCGWHPDNVDVTYVSDEVWRDITGQEV